VMAACSGEAKASAASSGAKIAAIAISTTSILARVTREAASERSRPGRRRPRPKSSARRGRRRAGRRPSRSRRDQHGARRTVGKAAPQHQAGGTR
jgi:hypothetical protein